MKYKYDVTIIIPVYNAEPYIDQCINSVIHQTYDFKKLEIILVDDASKDKSVQICLKYANKYENIKLFCNKTNRGVSYSRNLAIKEANGKYLLMLDSDDFIAPNAIEKLYAFFEKHYDEVDLVAYTLVYCGFTHEKLTSKKYSFYDKGTNIYDLDEYPYIEQSGVNVIFKSDKKHLYDEKMQLSEDHKFNTELLMKKNKIGFCKEAIYYYRREDNGLFMTKSNPYYCFEYIIKYNEYIVNRYKVNNKIPRYIQGVILSTINWRLESDQLIPYHYSGLKYRHAIKRMKDILKYLDVEVIINDPIISENTKFFLLKWLNKEKKVSVTDGKYTVYVDNVIVLNDQYIELAINRFKLRDNKILMMGYMDTFLHQFIEPNLYVKIITNDNQVIDQKIDLFESNESYCKTTLKISQFYGFKFEIEINNIKEFSFYTIIKNQKFLMRYNFGYWAEFNTSLGRFRIVKNKQIVEYDPIKKRIIIKKEDLKSKFLLPLTEVKKYAPINPKIMYFRNIARHKQNIWLYIDSRGVFNNAFVQFKHDFKIDDGIDRYYVYFDNTNILSENFTQEEQKKLVQFGSEKHKALFLKCKKILTSFAEFHVYSPFANGYKYYSDLIDYDLIYLQHGILHAKLLSMYSKECTQIDKIVVSTNFEIDNLQKNYHYDENDLILSGMPRMENTSKRDKNSNKIVLAPSWRGHLVGPIRRGKRKELRETFLKSNFYIKINELLNSPKLDKLLQRNDMLLEFKLHPNFQCYKDLFRFSSNRIKISFDDLKPEEYAIFITDFSSFQFDFAKLEIPIIYYIPDEEEFAAGLHTYRELDLKLEDAFGRVCYKADDLIKELEKTIENKCYPDKKYQERMHNFFLDIHNPCDKIYSSIKDVKE